MLLQLERNNFPPTGIVLSPLNWYGIQLTKYGDDNYQFVTPQGSAAPRLWGFPVVSSNAMREGEALVGNFEMAATFYDRRQTTLQISTENSDDFEKLMVTMRAYLRGLLAVERNNALVHNANMDTAAPTGS
jgi:HK97 family phage major capsid protein